MWTKFEDQDAPHLPIDWLLTIEFGSGSRCVSHCYRDELDDWLFVGTEKRLDDCELKDAKPIAWMPVPQPMSQNEQELNMETKVSKTSDGELLIHKEDGKGGYVNLIVDEDGDIEIMHIKSDKSKTWSKVDASVDEAINFWNDWEEDHIGV